MSEEAMSLICLATERLIDADLLTSKESMVLLAESNAVRESLEKGDIEAARAGALQLICLMERFAASGAIAPSDTLCIVREVSRILVPLSDESH